MDPDPLLINLSVFSFTLLINILALALLLICSALISGSEIAFFSLSPSQLDELKNEKEQAKVAFDQYVDHLARGLSLVCNILDPDIIVLGGGMSNISYIYENIDEAFKKYIFSDTFHTKVVKNIHGDSGGVRGAAWLS